MCMARSHYHNFQNCWVNVLFSFLFVADLVSHLTSIRIQDKLHSVTWHGSQYFAEIHTEARALLGGELYGCVSVQGLGLCYSAISIGPIRESSGGAHRLLAPRCLFWDIRPV